MLQRAQSQHMKQNKNKQGILHWNPLTWLWTERRCTPPYLKVEVHCLRINGFSDPCAQTPEKNWFFCMAWEDIAHHSEKTWQGLAQWLAAMLICQKALTSPAPSERSHNPPPHALLSGNRLLKITNLWEIFHINHNRGLESSLEKLSKIVLWSV